MRLCNTTSLFLVLLGLLSPNYISAKQQPQVAVTSLSGKEEQSYEDTVHLMPPNPKPYIQKYDDGTESPLITLRVERQISPSSSSSSLIYEETLDGYTVEMGKDNKYVYVDIDTNGNLVQTKLVAGEENDKFSKEKIQKNAARRRYEMLKKEKSQNSSSSSIPNWKLKLRQRKNNKQTNHVLPLQAVDLL
jgi:hypothetical protein